MDFQLIKFVHVLLAIVAVGFNASYGIWLARSANAPQATQSHVLRTIKFLDDRIANPAYGLLLLTGVLMIFSAGIPIRLWIALSIGLWLVFNAGDLTVALQIVSTRRAGMRYRFQQTIPVADDCRSVFDARA